MDSLKYAKVRTLTARFKRKMMKAIIFNGSLERRNQSTTSRLLSDYLLNKLQLAGIEGSIFWLADAGIPFFEGTLKKVPLGVEMMKNLFLEADLHFWLAPLYHGSIPGIMKNCLDWLEITAEDPRPYLTDKTVGLICWADGSQALQGINAMDTIAKSLRAWPLPYSVSISKSILFDKDNPGEISDYYKIKLDRLFRIAISHRIEHLTGPAGK